MQSLPNASHARKTLSFWCTVLCLLTLIGVKAQAQEKVVLSRGEATVMLEPYAPNIVRVTLSLNKADAVSAPGYGITASPSATGWSQESGKSGDVFKSDRIVVTVGPSGHWTPTGTAADIAKFFNGSTPGVGISFKTPDGKPILSMQGWQMSVPNHKDGNADILYDRRPTDREFFQVGASFHSPKDEHYYGLGQNQEGYMDRRGHVVRCAHDYNAPAGQSVCVPFVVTNYGYGLMWDNPSRTTVAFGFNDSTRWTSDVGQRVSFFVIAGKTYDEIYEGYRQLTGSTPMLPKSAYGYIQCKQRYTSQKEVLDVAKGYRERHLPADVMVVDWFYYTKMGQMDMDPAKWPDPTAMNRELHAMGFHSMISVWPRFVPGSRFYDMILKNGWFEHLADGTPTNGLPYDRAGSDIDTTNPDAAKWYWDTVRDNFVSKGFDAFWADETEPDLPPNGSYFHGGPGTEFFNVYPLFHTAAFYNGFRQDLKTRALILSRDAYLGAQHNGAIFWSSDIAPNWDTLKRQVPTGINFVASGMPYWSTDIGGWQYLPAYHKPEHPPLLDPSDARDNVGHYDDYPELYTRWFEYGAFQPNFRSHGSRKHNEVWSYGKQAEPILEKYLRLRYELMPYIYSLGYMTHETGAPFMRGLFMDFPNDEKVANIGDEYMFGPAFLVAPVTEQGATTRSVYLPAGTDWYNFWTNERLHGGQRVTVAAPIDTLPLFVRAGSIVPLGEAVESTNEVQKIAKVRVYPGADGDFQLYSDDGTTYDYEKGKDEIAHLHWSDAAGKLTSAGAKAWTKPDAEIVEVVGK
ncbi:MULTISPECIES: glycoside hydrolase family 31 protein [Acidobacteriaceae]|uniref:glycoside hydrolase family 31 protein n=1 Tax=Acidobacteriaceae TaxID=204434 RepID=UPI00131E4E09|nr:MULTISPECIES: glycoside hydrolase family 31 protein [Acidobacteriaceae]MDW5264564.1 glycoside hydrolase family 31 protein [Edaphobacter sp.]